MHRCARIATAVLCIFVLTSRESQADDGAVHSPNLTPVANLAYPDRYDTGANQGTDIEFARLRRNCFWIEPGPIARSGRLRS